MKECVGRPTKTYIQQSAILEGLMSDRDV